jgi:hypothetical protein
MVNKARDYVKYYLYEAEIFNEKEISNLSTDSLNDSIREIARAILGSIMEKSDKVNTAPIDKSKGDIKYLPNLESLQVAVNQLETMIERHPSNYDSKLVRYLKEVERSLLNINKYANEFKEAYKNRKTLLILKYQSLIMSVFSAVSYLISVMVDFSTGDIKLKDNSKYEEIAPLKTLIDFNKSVERGDFRSTIKEVSGLREEFLEVGEEDLQLLEAYDLSTILVDGINMLYKSFSDHPKVIDFLYKSAGIITLLISLREVFYMFFKAKSKVEDVASHIDNFASSSNGSPALLAKLNTFSNKYVVDAEESSKMAQREIESENRSLRQEVQAIPRLASKEPEKIESEIDSEGFEDLGFGF